MATNGTFTDELIITKNNLNYFNQAAQVQGAVKLL